MLRAGAAPAVPVCPAPGWGCGTALADKALPCHPPSSGSHLCPHHPSPGSSQSFPSGEGHYLCTGGLKIHPGFLENIKPKQTLFVRTSEAFPQHIPFCKGRRQNKIADDKNVRWPQWCSGSTEVQRYRRAVQYSGRREYINYRDSFIYPVSCSHIVFIDHRTV